MSLLLRALRSPGARREVAGSPPTQPASKDGSQETKVLLETAPTYVVKTKAAALDRGLDRIVRFSGSAPAFLFIQASLLAWALLGIPFNTYAIWPIVISNVQAVFSYIFDSFLMRQQLNGYYEGLDIAAELQSRSETTTRLLDTVGKWVGSDMPQVATMMKSRERPQLRLPPEDRFTKFITWSSIVLGHILFVGFYWICIFVWIGFGPTNDWSNQWQLDINSSTSALMVFVFSFLAILRERHADYLRSLLDHIYRVDGTLEVRLRQVTGDDLPNPTAIIPSGRISALQRAINYYADIVGTLVGIALLMMVLIAWVAVGPLFQFSANWWLFIGTYAGLMGLNDGFVLRNVQASLREHEEPEHAKMHARDAHVFNSLGLAVPTVAPPDTSTLSHRISERIMRVCGHEYTVLLGVLLIVGLLAGSSAMLWSETGQLLSNVPPSIIESFFMIILITGHNAADRQRRNDMARLFEARCELLVFVDAASDFLARSGGGQAGQVKGEKSPLSPDMKTTETSTIVPILEIKRDSTDDDADSCRTPKEASVSCEEVTIAEEEGA